MFEFDNSTNVWRGSAIRNARVAQSHADDATDLDGIARRNYASAMAFKEKFQKAQERIAELEAALPVKTAHAAGLDAETSAYSDQHPDSLLRVDSGRRYKDGDIKRRITLVYEKAFDAKLRELLPTVDPRICRAD